MVYVKNTSTNKEPLSKADSWKMFDSISHRYDFLNHFLSMGFDISWRKKLRSFLPSRQGLKICDLATGTADVLLTLTRNNASILTATGVDRAEKMLAIGRKKINKSGLDSKITLNEADINALPFEDKCFDVNTIAFGIRNVDNPVLVLKEMYRTLIPGGTCLILEFSLPRNPFIKLFYLFYLRFIVPILGGLLSGHFRAYSYLNRTIEQFYYGETFLRLMRQVGFQRTEQFPLMLGIATIYRGKRAE